MTGKAFDMRILRKDANLGGFEYTQKSIYSFELTKEFILMVVEKYPGTTVYFNDPAIWRDDKETNKYVSASDSSHNNHLHVMFPGGKE